MGTLGCPERLPRNCEGSVGGGAGRRVGQSGGSLQRSECFLFRGCCVGGRARGPEKVTHYPTLYPPPQPFPLGSQLVFECAGLRDGRHLKSPGKAMPGAAKTPTQIPPPGIPVSPNPDSDLPACFPLRPRHLPSTCRAAFTFVLQQVIKGSQDKEPNDDPLVLHIAVCTYSFSFPEQ